MSERLKGKVAIITGAASGQGNAEAQLFAQEGAKIVTTDINDHLLNKQAEKIRENYGDVVLPLQHDVTKEDDWSQVVKKAIDKFGQIDILVNNAGIGLTDKTSDITTTTVEDWNRFFATNSTAHFLGVKHVVPEMRKRNGGSIINISSLAAVQGIAGASPYTASKGASRAFTKGAARDLGKYNIRVNAVLPGWIVTPMMQQITLDKKTLDSLIDGIPLSKLGDPKDVAYPVLFLASDESKYITGAEIIVDGGQSARG